jgi:two-component system, cell cycle sensor histidine kinase and response regulator CckA
MTTKKNRQSTTQIAPLPDIRLIDRPTALERVAPRESLDPIPERKTVLVVDDDPQVLRIVMRALEQENYDLSSADSGPMALQKVKELGRPIDLLITDYVMPAMNGRQLALELWRQDHSLKALYITGFSDLLFDQRIELEAFAAFIEKPFSPRGLLEAARLLLFGCVNPKGVAQDA